MAHELGEQINTVERALGECMIEHALIIVRSWLTELGENNPYEEAYLSIYAHYKDLFAKWLNMDDPELDAELNRLTGDAYQLVDAVYVDLRLKRGLSPKMHGFNPAHPQSLINYFSNCVQLRKEDLDWLREAINNPDQTAQALIAIASLTRNLRECFSLDAMLTLIEGFNAENEIVADQCIANVASLLIHYDIRLDFFPQLQDAFTSAVSDMGDVCVHLFEVICAMFRMSKISWLEDFATGLVAFDDMPKEMQQLIEATGLRYVSDGSLFAWVPKDEAEYMSGLVQIFPNTWLYEVIVRGNTHFENHLTMVYLLLGNRDLMWDHPDVGERWYVKELRNGSKDPMDYINYAHCLLLKGDRMMAFETYRQARELCASSKDFYTIFRPDRHMLVEHGVPVEYIYLLEDQLINA